MNEAFLIRRKGMIRLGLFSFLLLSLLAACGSPNSSAVTATPKKVATPTPFGSPETSITPPRAEPHILPTPTLPPTPTPITLGPAPVLGIQGDPRTSFTGIPWVRLSYPTCGGGNLRGNVLKQTI